MTLQWQATHGKGSPYVTVKNHKNHVSRIIQSPVLEIACLVASPRQTKQLVTGSTRAGMNMEEITAREETSRDRDDLQNQIKATRP